MFFVGAVLAALVLDYTEERMGQGGKSLYGINVELVTTL